MSLDSNSRIRFGISKDTISEVAVVYFSSRLLAGTGLSSLPTSIIVSIPHFLFLLFSPFIKDLMTSPGARLFGVRSAARARAEASHTHARTAGTRSSITSHFNLLGYLAIALPLRRVNTPLWVSVLACCSFVIVFLRYQKKHNR